MHAARWIDRLLLLGAAGLVLWIRLVPLGLPAVDTRAEATARQQLSRRLAEALPADLPPARRAVRMREDVDRWIDRHPDEHAAAVHAEAERLRAQAMGTRADGRPYVLLGDLDSYLWLRQARNLLATGTTCDALVDGDCRDTHTLAPLGTTARYAGSLHVVAIAGLHRLATWFDPDTALTTSAYWVPVIVGVLGVWPAFAIGRRLAGPVGGWFAALTSALHPQVLQRSLGSDNDVWNVVLPLYIVWMVIEGLGARRTRARAIWAAAAGALTGVHAAIWNGWRFGLVVVLAGLAAAAALHALRAVVQSRPPRPWTAAPVRAAALVAVVYFASAVVATALAGGDLTALRLPFDALDRLWSVVALAVAHADPSVRVATWPATLATVSELWEPNLGAIAGYSYGHLLFFVGWLGLLLLPLPRARWQPAHFMVLIGGTLLYRVLLTAQLEPSLLLALLLLPLAAAVAVHAIGPAEEDPVESSAAVLVAVWLLAALFLAFDAVRFLLLLAAPFGIAAGVAVGRLHLWLDAQAARQPRLPARPARALALVACAALAVLPLRQSYAYAAAYVPYIDRAWVDTLERLRTTAAPDAVINAWWDYGYWIAYYGDRRVSADGGMLLSHVPYWLGRAQLAPSEAETAGLLRMLNCGSEATPLEEGQRGAYGKLRRYGVDDVVAWVTLVRLASLPRADADAVLAQLGLADGARADVLASTHCTPPDSYLILTTDQGTMGGWWSLGTWDARRDYLARTLRTRSEADAVAELTGPLGLDDAEARQLYGAARGLDDEDAIHRFAAPSGRFLTADWVACETTTAGDRRCPVGVADVAGTIDAVRYPADAPRRAVLETTPRGAIAPLREPPSVLLLAGPDRIEEQTAVGSSAPYAVLIDPSAHRALVGTANALRSTYTALVHLDGRYARHFHKVDERTGMRGQRVVTWRMTDE